MTSSIKDLVRRLEMGYVYVRVWGSRPRKVVSEILSGSELFWKTTDRKIYKRSKKNWKYIYIKRIWNWILKLIEETEKENK